MPTGLPSPQRYWRTSAKVGLVTGPGHPERGGEALGEDRLAGAEVADQQDDVTGPAQRGQRARPAPGCRRPTRSSTRSGQLTRRSAAIRRFARTKSARISAMASPPARST